MKSKVLLQSVIAAVISGAATGASVAASTAPIDWVAVKQAAYAGALVGLLALLKQSPVCKVDTSDNSQSKK